MGSVDSLEAASGRAAGNLSAMMESAAAGLLLAGSAETGWPLYTGAAAKVGADSLG